nr:MAG: ORF1 protein [Xinmoviridae sp. 2]
MALVFVDTDAEALTLTVAAIAEFNAKIVLKQERCIFRARVVNGAYSVTSSVAQMVRNKQPNEAKIIINGYRPLVSGYTHDIAFTAGTTRMQDILIPIDFAHAVRSGKTAIAAIGADFANPFGNFLSLMSLDKTAFEPIFNQFYDRYGPACGRFEELEEDEVATIDREPIASSREQLTFYILVFTLSLSKGNMSEQNYNTWVRQRGSTYSTVSGVTIATNPSYITITRFQNQAQLFPDFKTTILNFLSCTTLPNKNHVLDLLHFNQMTGVNMMASFIAAPQKSASHIQPDVLNDVRVFMGNFTSLRNSYGALFEYYKFIEPESTVFSQRTLQHLYAASLVYIRDKDTRYRSYSMASSPDLIQTYTRLNRFKVSGARLSTASWDQYSRELTMLGFTEDSYAQVSLQPDGINQM